MRAFLIILLVGAAAALAYVYGAKAGRTRYREITHAARTFWNDPLVAKARVRAVKSAKKATKKAAKEADRVTAVRSRRSAERTRSVVSAQLSSAQLSSAQRRRAVRRPAQVAG